MKSKRLFELSKTAIIKYIVQRLMKEYKISADEAYNKFMKTLTFEALQKPETAMAEESPAAVYEMLKLEIQGKAEEWTTYNL